jgi:hypothetical protein
MEQIQRLCGIIYCEAVEKLYGAEFDVMDHSYYKGQNGCLSRVDIVNLDLERKAE